MKMGTSGKAASPGLGSSNSKDENPIPSSWPLCEALDRLKEKCDFNVKYSLVRTIYIVQGTGRSKQKFLHKGSHPKAVGKNIMYQTPNTKNTLILQHTYRSKFKISIKI